MKKTIRRGVFETNSSSTHSITMCSKDEYDKWEAGALLKADSGFITREEAINELKNDTYFKKHHPNFDFNDTDAVNDALSDNEYYTSEQFWDGCDMETFESTYKTKSGETIVAFGYYGYDG